MKKRIIKLGNKIIINFPEVNKTFEGSGLTEEQLIAVKNAEKPEAIVTVLHPEYEENKQKVKEVEDLITRGKNSRYLTFKKDSFYWSDGEIELPLSIPEDLVRAIIKAENINDKDALTGYKNFWILMCLNKDERVRKNLYWFLDKWGLKVSKCGFFVGYRNVDFTDEEGVYTDHHSHKFKIRIGEMVTMDRSKCDPIQENQCSTGLAM